MKTHSFRFIAALIGVLSASTVSSAEIRDQLVFTEFFESIYIAETTGADFRPARLNDSRLWGELVIESSSTLLASSFSDLYRINLATGEVTVVGGLPGVSISGLALQADGTVLATAADTIYTIDTDSGVATPRVSESFFSPSHVTVAPDGDIYITEFFDALVRLDPMTYQPTTVNLSSALSGQPSLIQALPNGELALYLSDGSLARVNPDTGDIVQVVADLSTTFVNGFGLNTNGQLLVADSDEVFQIDPLTAVRETLVRIEPFFSPSDVASGGVLVPEPTTAWGVLALIVITGRRMRLRETMRY